MGFEQTISDYRQAKHDLAGGSAAEQEFIRAMALQKAWADRMVEQASSTTLNEVERETLAVETTETLGDWFRSNIMEFPPDENKASRKRYYLDLFDQDPVRAVRELQELYQSGLH